ncbi:MAG: AAA family ATPase [archaeon]
MTLKAFNSIENLYNAINNYGYICDINLVISLYVAYHLNKPILLQGPPGIGKTEIAKVVSNLINSEDPIRLQCFEGIDASQAIYDWDYKKQLLYIESCKNQKIDWKNLKDDLYSDDFLSVRPLLKSILSDKQEVILIDELDKSDEEFEAFLLEFLAEQQISISENKTIKAKNIPICFITSNNYRELSDAILRRCVCVFLDYPTMEREIEIIYTKVKDVDSLLATQITGFVQLLRKENLKKIPSISETIDWVKALVKLEAKNLNNNLVKSTLNILLKTQSDLETIDNKIESYLKKIPSKAIKIDKEKIQFQRKEQINNILENDDNWNF